MTAELHHDATHKSVRTPVALVGASERPAVEALTDVEDVFMREGLEEEQVAGVVVRAHRFGIRVDHDGLVSQFARGLRRVHAAIVELEPLSDTVGAAAEHDDLRLVGDLKLVIM